MELRLREIREDRDVNQTELAKLLGTTQATYSRYETGKSLIPYASLSVLADYYQTSVDYLLYRTDCSKPYPKRKRPIPED